MGGLQDADPGLFAGLDRSDELDPPRANSPRSFTTAWQVEDGATRVTIACMLVSVHDLRSPWTIFADGSAMPNPGRMGLGVVLIAPDGTRYALSRMPQGTGCNNEAELRALSLALQDLRTKGATDVLAYSDNSVLVAQLGSAGEKPIARLAALYDEGRDLLASFERVSLVWVPRHRNGEADALARAALGVAPRRTTKAMKGRRSARAQARQQAGGGGVEPGDIA